MNPSKKPSLLDEATFRQPLVRECSLPAEWRAEVIDSCVSVAESHADDPAKCAQVSERK
jgi:hypothetical protein